MIQGYGGERSCKRLSWRGAVHPHDHNWVEMSTSVGLADASHESGGHSMQVDRKCKQLRQAAQPPDRKHVKSDAGVGLMGAKLQVDWVGCGEDHEGSSQR